MSLSPLGLSVAVAVAVAKLMKLMTYSDHDFASPSRFNCLDHQLTLGALWVPGKLLCNLDADVRWDERQYWSRHQLG